MKLWKCARLFAAIARVNQAFFHKDTKIEWGTLTRPMGNLMRALSPWINSAFVVQLPHKGSNWTDLQRLPQRVFVMFLEDGKLCPPFDNKKIVWENLDIKWIKVPSIYSIVHNDFDVITENDQQFNKGDHQSEDWIRHRSLIYRNYTRDCNSRVSLHRNTTKCLRFSTKHLSATPSSPQMNGCIKIIRMATRK